MRSFSENNDLIITRVRNGRGIVTKRSFASGETVFEVRGPRIECNEDDDIDEEMRNNTYRYDDQYYISPQGRIGDFLNHSCNPNAKVVKRGKQLFVVSIRSIPAGREVLIDYSTITAADDIWTMRCNCGSTRCRGIVRRFAALPRALRAEYQEKGIVSPHILAIE